MAKHHTSSFIKCDGGQIRVRDQCHKAQQKGTSSLIVKASWLLGELDKEQRLNMANKCQQHCTMLMLTSGLFLSLH